MRIKNYVKYLLPKPNDRAFDKIAFYMFIYSIGGMIIPSSRLIGSVIAFFSYFMIFREALRASSYKIPFSGPLKLLFIVFIILDIYCVVIQSFFKGEYMWGNEFFSFLSYFFALSEYYPAYLLPLLFFIHPREFSFKAILKLAPVVAIISAFGYLSNYKFILMNAYNLSADVDRFNFGQFSSFYNVAICLFLVPFLKDKKRYLPIWILGLITLLVTMIYARRGDSLTNAVYLSFACFLFIYVRRSKFIKLAFIPVVIAVVSLSLYFVNSQSNGLFQLLNERGTQDTRAEVDEYFKKDMFNSNDLYFGRGLNGTYFCPQIYQTPEGIESIKYRHTIETGFYHLILKGGLIYALLYLIVLGIPSIFGIFFSKNWVTRILGVWIMFSLFELYPFGWPAFNVKFLIIWMGAVICANHRLRSLNNNRICKLLNIS